MGAAIIGYCMVSFGARVFSSVHEQRPVFLAFSVWNGVGAVAVVLSVIGGLTTVLGWGLAALKLTLALANAAYFLSHPGSTTKVSAGARATQ